MTAPSRAARRVLAAGPRHSLGLRADGTVDAAGGRVLVAGDGTPGRAEIETWGDVVDLAAGPQHSLALRADGSVFAAGDDAWGQMDVGRWRLARPGEETMWATTG